MALNSKTRTPLGRIRWLWPSDALKLVVGQSGWSTHSEVIEPHVVDWTGDIRGSSPLLLRPASTEEVAAVVGICRDFGLSIVQSWLGKSEQLG